MQVRNIVGAYRAVCKLQNCELSSFRDAMTVNSVREFLKKHIYVLSGEENKIIRKHGGKMKEHRWNFPDSDSERVCAEELQALHCEDIEIDIPKYSIKMPTGAVNFRPSDVACLLEIMEVTE